MKIKYKKGNWLIENERYIDDFGFEADRTEIINLDEDGTLIHYPIMGFPKANNLTRKDSIGKKGFEYTKKDLKEMLENFLSKLKDNEKSL